MMDEQHPPAPRFAPRDYRVSAERRQRAVRARRTIAIVSLSLIALAVLAWVVFPPGEGTRVSLSYSTIVLAILAVLMLLRLVLLSRKADRFVASDGAVLQLSPQGILVAGDTLIPWRAVSGVWALDSAPALRARASGKVFGAPGRAMLEAGVNTANLTFGVVDVAQASDPSGRIRGFRALPSGVVPGRLELPFGSQFGTAELHDALTAMRAALPVEVPVRLADGAMDYAAAWSGVADDVAEIRRREAERGLG